MPDPAQVPQANTPSPSLSTPATPEGDTSQYIRTYAKDVARLTNQPMPVSPKAQLTQEGVTLPDVDESPVNRPGGFAREFPQEVLDIQKEDSVGIFAHPQGPIVVPPQAAPPPLVSDTEEREAVLKRLREKISIAQQAAPPIPPPPPPPPPMTPPPGVVPVQKQEASPLHTFTSDFADRIDEKQASTFSVLAAQADSTEAAAPVPQARRSSYVPVVLALFLIVLGIGGLYAAYVFVGTREAPRETLGVPSLILADEKMELQGPDYRQALRDAADQPLVEGNILVTYVTAASSTQFGLRAAPQPGGALIRLLALGAPDILMRNVDLSSTVGVIAAGGQSHPFFILRVNSYERTFAGMLGWESRMLEDLAPLYPSYELPVPDVTASTTATSTAPLPPLPGPTPEGFVDAVISNHDVRMLKDRYGRTLVLYGYSDKATLIIARDEAAFTALIARLTASRAN